MRLIKFFIFFLFTLLSCSDDEPTKVIPDKIFGPKVTSDSTYTVLVQEGVEYARGLSHETVNSSNPEEISLQLDIYRPDNALEGRPAMLLIHGGGFTGGSRTNPAIVNLANYFASRGWVAFSISYRLQKDNGTVPSDWVNYANQNFPGMENGFLKLYPAHRDAKAALRWIVSRASLYKIDPEYITVGGGSAGAIIATTLGISDPADYTNEISTTKDPSLSTASTSQNYAVETIIDFWGSKVGLDALELIYGHDRFDGDDANIIIFHGTEDPTVDFEQAGKLRDEYIKTGVAFAYHPLQGAGHGAWNFLLNGKRLEEVAFNQITDWQDLEVE